jgi:hypothetical protein
VADAHGHLPDVDALEREPFEERHMPSLPRSRQPQNDAAAPTRAQPAIIGKDYLLGR